MQSFVTFFLFKNKTSKNTHTLTQNVKQKHCLVVRKSSSQEEATTLGEVSPGKLRGRSHSRQIPHSSSKRVLLPLFISKKENLSRSPVVLARFLAKPLNQSLEPHTRSHTRKQHWKTTPDCVRPEPEPQAPEEEPVLRSCVCVKKKTQFG